MRRLFLCSLPGLDGGLAASRVIQSRSRTGENLERIKKLRCGIIIKILRTRGHFQAIEAGFSQDQPSHYYVFGSNNPVLTSLVILEFEEFSAIQLAMKPIRQIFQGLGEIILWAYGKIPESFTSNVIGPFLGINGDPNQVTSYFPGRFRQQDRKGAWVE